MNTLKITDDVLVVMEQKQIFIICNIFSPSLPFEGRNTIKNYWFSSLNEIKLIKLRPYELDLQTGNRAFGGTY